MYFFWKWQIKLIICLAVIANIFVAQVQSQKLKNWAKFKLSQSNLSEPLRVLSRHYEPFMYREGNGQFFNGIEYKLLEVIAEKEQMKLFFHNQPVSLTDDELTLSSSDIIAGGLFPNSTFADTLTTSKPYYQDDLTWCIQKAKYYPWILRIAFMATSECWVILIFGIGYTSGFVIYLMIQFDSKYMRRNCRDWHYTTWLVALPAVITFNQRFRPFYTPLRVFYGLLLLLSVVLWQITVFNAIRYIKLPVQREQIKMISQIVADEFRLAGSTDVLRLISFDDWYEKSQIDSFFVCSSIERCLEHLKHDDNSDLAIGGSRSHILNSRAYSPSEIYCFDGDERIAGYQPMLLMRKDFALKLRANEIIQRAFEGGLFVKWKRDNQKKREHVIPTNPPSELTMEELSFMFAVFCVGCVLSTLASISERIIHRKMNQANHSSVWVYLEQFFDGQRHYLKNLPDKLEQNMNFRNILFDE